MPSNARYRFEGLIPGIRGYVRRAALAGEPTTLSGAADALTETRPRAGGKGLGYSTPIRTAFAHLERAGIAVLDTARSTPNAPVYLAWNWAGLPLGDQTLRSALEPYLLAPTYVRGTGAPPAVPVALPDGRTRTLTPLVREDTYQVVTAVRALLAARFGAATVGRKDDRAALFAACDRIPVAELRALPDEVRWALPGATGEKYHTSLARLLAYAAAHDLVALYVPAPEFAHQWALWATAQRLSKAERTTLYKLHGALVALRGNAAPATPDAVSIADANAALARIRAAKQQGLGKRAAADLESLLTTLGLAGCGPYRELATTCSMVKAGRQIVPKWMLPTTGTDETTGAQGFASTAALLANRGFAPQWGAFYRWYAAYSTLDAEAVASLYPGLRRTSEIRRLDPSTSRQRHQALRVWAGLAIAAAPLGLGLTPAEATPAVVFGERFGDILEALKTAWRQRVEEQERLRVRGLPVPGHAVTLDSPSLDRHVVNAGLIAEALATWATWCATQGEAVAPAEIIAAWAAAHAAANTAVLQAGEDGRRGTLRTRKRTQRDIAQISADLSSLALLRAEQTRALRLIATAPHEKGTAEGVQRYLVGALVAMGSPRIGELGILEYGRHYDVELDQAAGRREVPRLRLDGKDRKAGGNHVYALIEAIVPRALWRWHQEKGRPLLMAPWLAGDRPAHDAIFVSPKTGGPFGGIPDYTMSAAAIDAASDPDSRVAAEVARLEAIDRCVTNASAGLSAQYERWRREALARRPGYTFTKETRGHHAAHGARNQELRVLQELGLQEYAALILGHKTKRSSEEMYGCSQAALVARVMQEVMDAAPWNRAAGAEVHAPTTIQGARSRSQREREQQERDATLGRAMRDVLAKQAAGNLSPKHAAALLDEVARQFGIDGAAEDAAPAPALPMSEPPTALRRPA